jgi:hypothetical protein
MIYDFSQTLLNPQTRPRLINFMVAHSSSVLRLNFVSTSDGNTHLVSAGADGRTILSSLQDFLNPTILYRTIGPIFAQTYSKLMQVVIYTDNDNKVKLSTLLSDNVTMLVAAFSSLPWDIDANEYCTFAAISTGDGLYYVNMKRAIARKVQPTLVPVYEIDIKDDEKIFKNKQPMKEFRFGKGSNDKSGPNMKSFRAGVYVVRE